MKFVVLIFTCQNLKQKLQIKSTIPEFAAVNATTLKIVKVTASFIISICVQTL